MSRIIGAISLLLAITFISSCGHFEMQDNQATYSNIRATNDTLDIMTKQWHQLLDMSVKTKNYAGLAQYRLRMGQFLNRSRGAVGKLKANSQSAAIIDSELVFLTNRATVVSDIYTPFETNNELTPATTIKIQMKTIANDINIETATSTAIKKSLNTFAVKNGINFPK